MENIFLAALTKLAQVNHHRKEKLDERERTLTKRQSETDDPLIDIF